jgi:predicted acyltransferase
MQRLASLDAFRGLTIAGMILVNNPGSWAAVYPPLEHAEWNGWTPTDLVFPFFLFIVGVSIALSLARRKDGAVVHILRRTLILFALGYIVLGVFPYFHFSTSRIPGVLQRIAVCYLVSSLVVLYVPWRGQAVIAAALLAGYCALMLLVPVPGFGAGQLDKAGNLAAYVDRAVLGTQHLWRAAKVYDPEGLLSTLPAIATTLGGALCGRLLLSERPAEEKTTLLLLAGAAAIPVGLAWNWFFPINKALWTSSYVVFTAGAALLVLGVCFWLMEVRNVEAPLRPLVMFGKNPIAIFVGSSFLVKMLAFVPGRPWGWVYEHAFAGLGARFGSLMMALAYVSLWLGVAALLYRKRIFIKI